MSTVTGLPPTEVTRFPSFTSLRAAHGELLKRQRENGDERALTAAIQEFIQRGKETGALLDDENDRQAAQSLLDYWSTYLYRSGESALEATLASFDPALAPELNDSLCPYQGLDAFLEENQKIFFGRQRLIESMLAFLKHNRFLSVIGSSGSGKSSVVRAGLVPSLKLGALPGSQDWVYLPSLVPGSRPLDSLNRLLPQETDLPTPLSLENPGQFAEQITSAYGPNTVIVVDQFEELFTLCEDDASRKAFVNSLLSLVKAPGTRHTIIITMRTDFESQIPLLPDFQETFERSIVRVTPLTARELREAIEEPARLIGLKFESGVVDALLSDILGEPAALPLLQFSLLKLWENRERNRVTWDAYLRIGGGRQALAKSADQFYHSLIPEEQVTAKRILLRLVRPGEGLEITSSRIRRGALYHKAEAFDRIDRVLDRFIQARLLRLTKGDTPADDQIEVAHEALVRNWPTLVGWLEDERVHIRERRRLTSAAEKWRELNQDPSTLLRGLLLDEALRFDDLNALESEFVQASQQAAEKAAREREAAQQRELEQAHLLARAKEQSAQRMRWLAIALAILILFALGAALNYNRQSQQYRELSVTAQNNAQVAITQAAIAVQAQEAEKVARQKAEQAQGAEKAARETAEAESLRANQSAIDAKLAQEKAESLAATAQAEATAQVPVAGSRLLAAQALSFLDSNPSLSALLGIEAYRVRPTWEAMNILLTRILREANLNVRPYEGSLPDQPYGVLDVAFSPDGKDLAWGRIDGSVMIREIASGKTVRSVRHTQQVTSLVFSAGGETLASGSYDRRILIWDVSKFGEEGYRPVLLFKDSEEQILSLSFNPKNSNELAAGIGKYVYIFDLEKKEQINRMQHAKEVYSLAWSPGGQWLAAGDGAGNLIIWDPENGQRFTTPGGAKPQGWISSLAWSPNSPLLAVGDQSGNIILYDTQRGESIGEPLRGQSQSVLGLSFSRDGRLLASGGADNTLYIWDVTAQSLVYSDALGYRIHDLAFTRGGGPNLLVTGGYDFQNISGRLNLFEVLPANPLYEFQENVPGKALALLAGLDGKLQIASPGSTAIGEAMGTDVTAAAFGSKEGSILAVGSEQGQIRLIDWNTQQIKARLELPGRVEALAISPQDRYLAASYCEESAVEVRPVCRKNLIRFWDLSTMQPLEVTLSESKHDWIRSLVFHPDGKQLISGSYDGSLLVWNFLEGKLVAEPEFRYPGGITSLAFLPGSSLLASGGTSGKLVLWEPSSYQPIGQPLEGAAAAIFSLAFDPVGKVLYSGDEIGNILKWNVDFQSWIERSCQLAGRNLTPEELAQYLPGKPAGYKTCPQYP